VYGADMCGAPRLAEGPEPARAAPGARWALAIVAVALAWAVAIFAAFHPGLMSIDALVHYGQGLANDYSNQHPPLVSWLFGRSGQWLGTPAGILALQLAAIGGGLALLGARAARRHGPLAFLVVAATLGAPGTFAIAAMLGKDALLAGALLLAASALRAGRRGVALGLALVATLLRLNALFAAVPLAFGAIWGDARLGGRRARAALAAAAVVVLAGAEPAVEWAVRARDVWPVGQLFAYDLAGIYVRHPEALRASTLARDVSATDLARLYTPDTGGPLLFPAPGAPGVSFHHLVERREVLTAEWLRAIRAYPGAYAAHRLEVLRALLGARRGPAFYPFHADLDPNPWGLALSRDTLPFRVLAGARDAARDGLAFRGWFWVGLSVAATALAAARARRDPVPLWIAASGLAYALAYAIIAVSAEFRYLYWTALSAPAALLALLAAPCAALPTGTALRRSGSRAPRSTAPGADR
jgi:hypothetical protein